MEMEMEMEKSGSSGRERNLHLHHHYTRQQLAPTSRFPSRGKGYASRAWPEGSTAINRKSLSLIIWPKRWQAWLTLIFGQNTRPGSKEKQKEKKSTRRDRSSWQKQRTFNALVYKERREECVKFVSY